MSSDRTTITRAEALRRKKAEKERQLEQNSKSVARPADPVASVSKLFDRSKPAATPRRQTYQQTRDIPRESPRNVRRRPSVQNNQRPAFGLPKVGLPSVNVPFRLPKVDFSSISVALIVAALTLSLAYVALYTTVFSVQKIDISGTKIVDPYEITNGINVIEQPLLTLDRKQVRLNILATYPEIKDVAVKPVFPNTLQLIIIERIPIAEWHQNGGSVWIDNEGYAFEPRTTNLSLPIVEALSPAPAPGELASEDMVGARPFIFPQLASAVQTVARMLPEGTTITYTPGDGLSWIDPIGGWEVLYGKTDGNNDEKMTVYNSLVTKLTQQGIVPTLINVEYPSNPTYQTADEE